MKKITVVSAAICLLVVAVTVADYTGLFGTETSTRFDFAEARFRIVEAGTGAPIFRTRVKCQQKGNDNACTLKDTRSDDVLGLLFPRHIRVTESLLFTLNEEPVKPAEPDIHIFFINPDYGTVNMTLPIMDILEGKAGVTRVEMQPR